MSKYQLSRCCNQPNGEKRKRSCNTVHNKDPTTLALIEETTLELITVKIKENLQMIPILVSKFLEEDPAFLR